MSRDGCAVHSHGAMGLSAVCDCGISWSYSLTILDLNLIKVGMNLHRYFGRSRLFVADHRPDTTSLSHCGIEFHDEPRFLTIIS